MKEKMQTAAAYTKHTARLLVYVSQSKQKNQVRDGLGVHTM